MILKLMNVGEILDNTFKCLRSSLSLICYVAMSKAMYVGLGLLILSIYYLFGENAAAIGILVTVIPAAAVTLAMTDGRKEKSYGISNKLCIPIICVSGVGNMVKSIFNNQRGSTTVMLAFALPVMLGCAALAVDVGYLYVNKAELSNAADAAVLAAVHELPKDATHAKNVSEDYAKKNKKIKQIKNKDVIDKVTTTITNKNKTISVSISRNVPLIFGPFLGINSSTVSARNLLQNP